MRFVWHGGFTCCLPVNLQQNHYLPSRKAYSDIHVFLSLVHTDNSNTHPLLLLLYLHRIDMDREEIPNLLFVLEIVEDKEKKEGLVFLI